MEARFAARLAYESKRLGDSCLTPCWVPRALDKLYQWNQQIVQGQLNTSRRNVVIVVLNEAGEDSARFVVSNAWPTKYDPSDLNARGNEVFIELLELANEGIERVS